MYIIPAFLMIFTAVYMNYWPIYIIGALAVLITPMFMKKEYFALYFVITLSSSVTILLTYIAIIFPPTSIKENCASDGGCWNKEMQVCANKYNGLPCKGFGCWKEDADES